MFYGDKGLKLDKRSYRRVEVQALLDGVINDYESKLFKQKNRISDLIVQNEKYDTRTFLNSICIKNNIQLKPIIEVERHGLIVEFVKEELGIGFATKQYIQQYLDNNELVELKVNINIDKRFINVVYRDSKNKKIANFINLLKQNTKK